MQATSTMAMPAAETATETAEERRCRERAAIVAKEIAQGLRCPRCDAYTAIPYALLPNQPTECVDCRNLANVGRVWHGSFIRCPACGDVRKADWKDHLRALKAGGRNLTERCACCKHKFSIELGISVRYISPPRG